MVTSLAPAAPVKPNLLDGGRPPHPFVLHLEGHVEELVALKDDEKVLARGAHVARLIRQAEVQCHEIVEAARNVAELSAAALIQQKVIRLARRLAEELAERAARLRSSAIPETTRCYAACEAAYGNLGTAMPTVRA